MAFIHRLAFVCGNVSLGRRTSVWPYVVIRGDTERVEVGTDSNIQDGTIIHADRGFPTIIGDRVGIGHRAIIHGAIIEPDSLVGMGAILLNGVRVGTGSIIAAGAVCREGMQIPPNSMVMGVPGRIVRETTTLERERIRDTVESYLKLQAEHAAGQHEPVSSGADLRIER
ncbi:MAG TPA: gamma carbonic anhydrase family protein [Gemmatimonadaceae bacterium]